MVDSKNNHNDIHYEKIQTNGWKQQILQSLYQNGYIPISIQFMHKLGCLNKILTIFELSNVVNASKFTVKAKNEINVSYIT